MFSFVYKETRIRSNEGVKMFSIILLTLLAEGNEQTMAKRKSDFESTFDKKLFQF